jgi:hypothetical protein
MLLLLVVVALQEHIYRNLLIANTSGLFITWGQWGQYRVGSTHDLTVILGFCCWFKPLLDHGISLPGCGLNW